MWQHLQIEYVDSKDPATTVRISNIAAGVEPHELMEHFRQTGQPQWTDITVQRTTAIVEDPFPQSSLPSTQEESEPLRTRNRMKDRNPGTATIGYATTQEAQVATEAMNGSNLRGQTLRVEVGVHEAESDGTAFEVTATWKRFSGCYRTRSIEEEEDVRIILQRVPKK